MQCLDLGADSLSARSVDHIDIAFDDLSSDKHYKVEEDPKKFRSTKTQRGPLIEGWRDDQQPIMCSYKVVSASFEVWGFQTRVEDYIQRCIRDVLLLGHRQAFAWIDDWLEMSIDDVRRYEQTAQAETNATVLQQQQQSDEIDAVVADDAGDGDKNDGPHAADASTTQDAAAIIVGDDHDVDKAKVAEQL